MLGHKSREFKRQVAVSLEALVPADNFYRQVDQCIDLSFVRDLAAEFYPNLGAHLLTRWCSSGCSWSLSQRRQAVSPAPAAKLGIV